METATLSATSASEQTASNFVYWMNELLFDKVGSLESPSNYSSVLLEILSLLTKPGIIGRLPERDQQLAGEVLKRLTDFFMFVEVDKELSGLIRTAREAE